MRISVVIPCHNRASLVREAVESVLAQSLPPVEIICVDDASSDGTWDVLQALARRTEGRVRPIRHEANQGAAATQNTAVAAATGDWICLLGDDDLLLPNALLRLTESQQANRWAGVVHPECWREWNLDPATRRLVRAGRHIRNRDPFPLLFQTDFVNTVGALIRRDWWTKAGGMDPGRVMAEDYDFWLRLARMGCDFLYVPEPLYVYRLTGDNLSHRRVEMNRGMLAVLEDWLRKDPEIVQIVGPAHVRSRLVSQRLKLIHALLETGQERQARAELRIVWRAGLSMPPVWRLRLKLAGRGRRSPRALRLIKTTANLLRDRAIALVMAAEDSKTQPPVRN
jgi:GT2 family glycosyltransferase